MLQQLSAVFSSMEKPLILKLQLDERPVSAELRTYMEALASQSDKLTVTIAAIKEKTELQILVSLSCTMCPELVMAAQHIAALNENLSAAVYDLNHFPELKEQYNVMSFLR